MVAAPQPHKGPTQHNRDYMRHEGTPRSIDIAHRVMDTWLEDVSMSQITDSDTELMVPLRGIEGRVHQTSAGLALMARLASDYVRETVGPPAKLRRYIEEHHPEVDVDRNDFSFEDGLGDQDFTWHFAPMLAHEVVKAAQRDGRVPQDTLQRMSLGDWAHLFECGWFRDLVHDCSLTANGQYLRKGRQSFNEYLADVPVDITVGQMISPSHMFEFDSVSDDTDELGETLLHVVARLTEPMRRELRDWMHLKGSAGCPVSRNTFTVSHEQMRASPHVERLFETEVVRELAIGKTGVRLVQDETPIDRSLSLLARLYERYVSQHGTPLVDVEQRTVTHDVERPLLRPFERDITDQLR